MLSEEKVAPYFVRQTISWSSSQSSRKHENIALKITTTKEFKFTHLAVAQPPFYLWVCLQHTFAVRNLIDSISFYCKFGKDSFFVLKVKQHSFDKARFFKINRVNYAIVERRKKISRNLRSPFAIIWKLSRQNKIRKITSFPLTTRLY